MKRFTYSLLLALIFLTLLAVQSNAWVRSPARTFATLPDGATNPEGITVDSAGNVYVSTFAVGGTTSGVGQIFVFKPSGRLLRQVDVEGSSTLLLELAFHPTTGALLVIDFGENVNGDKRVLNVDPDTGESTVFTTIPGGADAGPNVLTFDSEGNVQPIIHAFEKYTRPIQRTDGQTRIQ